jgi:hypothetical protein
MQLWRYHIEYMKMKYRKAKMAMANENHQWRGESNGIENNENISENNQ